MDSPTPSNPNMQPSTQQESYSQTEAFPSGTWIQGHERPAATYPITEESSLAHAMDPATPQPRRDLLDSQRQLDLLAVQDRESSLDRQLELGLMNTAGKPIEEAHDGNNAAAGAPTASNNSAHSYAPDNLYNDPPSQWSSLALQAESTEQPQMSWRSLKDISIRRQIFQELPSSSTLENIGRYDHPGLGNNEWSLYQEMSPRRMMQNTATQHFISDALAGSPGTAPKSRTRPNRTPPGKELDYINSGDGESEDSYDESDTSDDSLGSDREIDWTTVSDLVERRRLQNRIAQRNYRKAHLLLAREAQQKANQSNTQTRTHNLTPWVEWFGDANWTLATDPMLRRRIQNGPRSDRGHNSRRSSTADTLREDTELRIIPDPTGRGRRRSSSDQSESGSDNDIVWNDAFGPSNRAMTTNKPSAIRNERRRRKIARTSQQPDTTDTATADHTFEPLQVRHELGGLSVREELGPVPSAITRHDTTTVSMLEYASDRNSDSQPSLDQDNKMQWRDSQGPSERAMDLNLKKPITYGLLRERFGHTSREPEPESASTPNSLLTGYDLTLDRGLGPEPSDQIIQKPNDDHSWTSSKELGMRRRQAQNNLAQRKYRGERERLRQKGVVQDDPSPRGLPWDKIHLGASASANFMRASLCDACTYCQRIQSEASLQKHLEAVYSDRKSLELEDKPSISEDTDRITTSTKQHSSTLIEQPDFAYAPLANDQTFAGDQIRLLHILPGSDDDPIRCSLETVSLSQNGPWPKYESLSYCWQDGRGGKHQISIGNQSFYVSKTLLEALTRLRYLQSSRIFWIDAICIDQSNLVEKVHQIRLMRYIYQNASNVLIWLGESAKLPNMLLKLAATSIEAEHETGRIIDEDLTKSLHLTGAEQVATILQICTLPWFQRLWVVQELCLPRQAFVQLGEVCIAWDTLVVCMESAAEEAMKLNMRLEIIRLEANISVLKSARGLWQARSGRSSCTLLHQLALLRGRGCTLPADQIIGMLAICEGASMSNLTVNYDMPYTEVYIRATVHCINEQNLKVLSLCDGTSIPRNDTDHDTTQLSELPSWVPNWGQLVRPDNPPSFAILVDSGEKRSRYNASGRTAIAMSKGSNPPTQQLEFRGLIMTRIQRILPGSVDVDALQKLAYLDYRKQIQRRTTANLLAWYQAAVEHHGGDLNETQLESFWRTTCALGTWDPYETVSRRWFDIWFRTAKTNGTSEDVAAHLNRAEFDQYCDYIVHVDWVSRTRSFFITEDGRFGLASSQAKVGDEVAILLGGEVPFLLRDSQTEGMFWLVGECYCHGIMNGEFLKVRGGKKRSRVLFYVKWVYGCASIFPIYFALFNVCLNEPKLSALIFATLVANLL